MTPSTQLQIATYQDLIAANLPGVGAKVFHRVPAKTPLPYIEIGQDQILGDDEAGEFFDCFVEVSVFAKSLKDAKALADAAHAALSRPPVMENFICHEWHFTALRSVTQTYGSDQIEQITLELEYSIQLKP